MSLDVSPTGMEYLSFSRLSTYGGCGEKFRLSYIEKVPRQEIGSGFGGRAVHETIQLCESNELLTRVGLSDSEVMEVLYPDFRERFERLVEEAGGPDRCYWGGRKTKANPDGENYPWWLDYGRVFLTRYLMVRRADIDAGISVLPDTLEMEVSGYIGDVLVKGFIDAMGAVTADGEPIIRDWKTGSFLTPHQLAVYSWLLAQRDPPFTADRGQFIALRGATVDKMVREYDLREWREIVPRMFTDLIRGIEAGIFPIQPSNFCVACPVRAYCPYGRTLEVEGDGE